jgi:hypothetical protein
LEKLLYIFLAASFMFFGRFGKRMRLIFQGDEAQLPPGVGILQSERADLHGEKNKST